MSQLGTNVIAPVTSSSVEIQGLNPPNYLGSELAQKSQTVLKSGSTMTGPLVLSGNAANALEAVPKQQLDTAITNLDFSSSIGLNGYQRLPSGLLIQWGQLPITTGSYSTITTLTFPIAFPNACISITGNGDKEPDNTWAPITFLFKSRTTTTVSVVADTGNGSIGINNSIYLNWIAIGH